MQNKRYNTKWIIDYKGWKVAEIYGKRKAYELYVTLSHCVIGLEVKPASHDKKLNVTANRKDYYRRWRADNKDKIRIYNQRSRKKRKQAKHERTLGRGE